MNEWSNNQLKRNTGEKVVAKAASSEIPNIFRHLTASNPKSLPCSANSMGKIIATTIVPSRPWLIAVITAGENAYKNDANVAEYLLIL